MKYNASNQTFTATYAGKTWTATLSELGLSPTDSYNFLVTSSQYGNGNSGTYASGVMRADLDGATLTYTLKQSMEIQLYQLRKYHLIRKTNLIQT